MPFVSVTNLLAFCEFCFSSWCVVFGFVRFIHCSTGWLLTGVVARLRSGDVSSHLQSELRELVSFANNRQQIAETKLDLATRKISLLEEQLAASKRAADEARSALTLESAKVLKVPTCESLAWRLRFVALRCRVRFGTRLNRARVRCYCSFAACVQYDSLCLRLGCCMKRGQDIGCCSGGVFDRKLAGSCFKRPHFCHHFARTMQLVEPGS
jgi:hypothetical protein